MPQQGRVQVLAMDIDGTLVESNRNERGFEGGNFRTIARRIRQRAVEMAAWRKRGNPEGDGRGVTGVGIGPLSMQHPPAVSSSSSSSAVSASASAESGMAASSGPVSSDESASDGHDVLLLPLVVLVTNQGGLAHSSNSENKERQVLLRLERIRDMLRSAGLPTLIVMAPSYDWCRKPGLGCWQMACMAIHALTGGLEVDHERSIFVGDAAGRKRFIGRDDHSASDMAMAVNAGLRFTVPEHFLGEGLAALGSKEHKLLKFREESLLAVCGVQGAVPVGMAGVQANLLNSKQQGPPPENGRLLTRAELEELGKKYECFRLPSMTAKEALVRYFERQLSKGMEVWKRQMKTNTDREAGGIAFLECAHAACDSIHWLESWYDASEGSSRKEAVS